MEPSSNKASPMSYSNLVTSAVLWISAALRELKLHCPARDTPRSSRSHVYECATMVKSPSGLAGSVLSSRFFSLQRCNAQMKHTLDESETLKIQKASFKVAPFDLYKQHPVISPAIQPSNSSNKAMGLLGIFTFYRQDAAALRFSHSPFAMALMVRETRSWKLCFSPSLVFLFRSFSKHPHKCFFTNFTSCSWW